MAGSYVHLTGNSFKFHLIEPSDSTIVAADTILCQNLQTGEKTSLTRASDSGTVFRYLDADLSDIQITAPKPLVGKLEIVQNHLSACTVYNTGDFPRLRFVQCQFITGCTKNFISNAKQVCIQFSQCYGSGLDPLNLNQYSVSTVQLMHNASLHEFLTAPAERVYHIGTHDYATSISSASALAILNTLDTSGQHNGYVSLEVQQPEDTSQIDAKIQALQAKGWDAGVTYYAQPVQSDSASGFHSDSSSSSVGGGSMSDATSVLVLDGMMLALQTPVAGMKGLLINSKYFVPFLTSTIQISDSVSVVELGQ